MWLSRLDHKRHCSLFLAYSVGSLTLRKSNCHIVRTLKQPYGDVLLTASKELLPPANSYGSEIRWKQILQPQSSLQMTITLASYLDCNLMKKPKLEPPS